MTSPEFSTNEQIIQAAKRRLSQGPWDYLVGGSESETTMRRNRMAFDKVAFRPRILVNVSDVNTSTTLLGHSLRIPVMMAPVGSLQVFDEEGGVGVTKAASEFGVLHVVSSVTQPSLEEISISLNLRLFLENSLFAASQKLHIGPVYIVMIFIFYI